MGKLTLFRHSSYDSDSVNTTASDPAEEIKRLEKALKKAGEELDSLYRNALEQVGEGEAAIFEIHKMMLEDDDFLSEVRDRIRDGKFSAEKAVLTCGEALADTFRRAESEYMQARSADILAVSRRLIEVLQGNSHTLVLTEPSVVAADDLTPAETIEMDRDMVLGFVMEKGSELSHTAILARMMNIPAVVCTGKLNDAWNGKPVILDGTRGVVYLDPSEDTVAEFETAISRADGERKRLEQMRGKRCVSPLGERIFITANVGAPEDVDEALLCDAEGIGLFRSEFLFMRRNRPPTEEEQFEIYKSAAEKMSGMECVIRTLDVGADKRISYLTGDLRESNPALGIRAVRLCLRMPELLLTQFRALYRAAAFGNVSAMIPMIVLPSEVERVREIAAEARASLAKDGLPCGKMKVGIMIETPSAAILADLLAPMVDFFSIGTNDLIQYTLAADRENPDVAYLTKPLPESVRRCIRMTCAAARREGISVCVCGELGADPDEIRFLMETGVTKLSVAPSHILRVRERVREAFCPKESLY